MTASQTWQLSHHGLSMVPAVLARRPLLLALTTTLSVTSIGSGVSSAARICSLPFPKVVAAKSQAPRLAKLRGMTAKATEPLAEFAAVYVTVPSLETGKEIGRTLVSEKLAACVNVIPGLTSIYAWEGKVEEDSELLMMIKTRSALVPTMSTKIQSMHPYDVCEVIAVPIVDGNEPYLKWIRESTQEG